MLKNKIDDLYYIKYWEIVHDFILYIKANDLWYNRLNYIFYNNGVYNENIGKFVLTTNDFMKDYVENNTGKRHILWNFKYVESKLLFVVKSQVNYNQIKEINKQIRELKGNGSDYYLYSDIQEIVVNDELSKMFDT